MITGKYEFRINFFGKITLWVQYTCFESYNPAGFSLYKRWRKATREEASLLINKLNENQYRKRNKGK